MWITSSANILSHPPAPSGGGVKDYGAHGAAVVKYPIIRPVLEKLEKKFCRKE
jgi:hypothetical protein